ncbi:hypothetical protein O1611_g9515 [Lasiodiplodia mahajangana]|uniref:Uncharacterized protein n=1 Tax=Lasiodiplodia mahajangana TaxID=1108764 RepID=A0ACC2J8L6_9PEZI|nr:hypothetical protein O1611_g9515 [Lasiodiplodia mahajangana]
MSTTTKPKLAQLKTPVTATFPSELSALSASARTPLSAVPTFIKEEFPGSARTPISPPTAYMDFLKAMSVPSPVVPAKRSASGSTTPEEDSAQDSAPTTASSTQTDCSCKCGGPRTPADSPKTKASPYANLPLSAPPMSVTSFPSLKVPPSPAMSSTVDSPLSATIMSPFSARSTRSHFDWEAALKARYSQDCRAHKPQSKTVRHIREVVTRTVTYTPRMSPAPKGKRRRTHSSCQKLTATSTTTTTEITTPSASS